MVFGILDIMELVENHPRDLLNFMEYDGTQHRSISSELEGDYVIITYYDGFTKKLKIDNIEFAQFIRPL